MSPEAIRNIGSGRFQDSLEPAAQTPPLFEAVHSRYMQYNCHFGGPATQGYETGPSARGITAP